MSATFDLAVVGSGFAGSLLSMIARRLGLSVLLLERGRHPRVVIGESSTPLANLLLEQMADQYDLPRVRPLAKWGTWQRTYPELGCGLKRGFSFYHHDPGGAEGDARERRLLVAASPRDEIADTHWYRADVDEWLVREAQEQGAEYVDEVTLESATRVSADWMLRGRRHGAEVTFRTRFVVDASGPRGFLSRALQLETAPLPAMPATSSLYAHFRGVARFADEEISAAGYAPDDAALHHVFPGGWMWVLRFANGITSAGVAVRRELSERFALEAGSAGWQRLLQGLPAVRRQFAQAAVCTPFTYVPQLSFRSATVAGDGWALLPSAAGFVDPLLSTGFPLTLLGVARLASVFEGSLAAPTMPGELAQYATVTEAELLATARLVGALYRTMGDFEAFRAVSLLYFAAASYAETARRLGRPELAGTFLLQDDPEFGPESKRLLACAQEELSPSSRTRLIDDTYQLIERFDVAGLGARPTDGCYPVRAEDLYCARSKVGASRQEIDAMLERSGFLNPAAASTQVAAGTLAK